VNFFLFGVETFSIRKGPEYILTTKLLQLSSMKLGRERSVSVFPDFTSTGICRSLRWANESAGANESVERKRKGKSLEKRGKSVGKNEKSVEKRGHPQLGKAWTPTVRWGCKK
jgi:hypothetical protein